jgi:hypothetical protein
MQGVHRSGPSAQGESHSYLHRLSSPTKNSRSSHISSGELSCTSTAVLSFASEGFEEVSHFAARGLRVINSHLR